VGQRSARLLAVRPRDLGSGTSKRCWRVRAKSVEEFSTEGLEDMLHHVKHSGSIAGLKKASKEASS
jgi:hypothetical protein